MLIPVIQMLVLARELDDVRSAIAHGARIVSRYDSLTLFERATDGSIDVTTRRGAEIPPNATSLERRLAEKAMKTNRTASTLDRVADLHEQAQLDEYTDASRLAIARPLWAYGDLVGALVLHYHDRSMLPEPEFDELRRFCEFAAAALSSARLRAELDGYAHTDPLTGLANRRRLGSEFERLTGMRLAILLVDFDGLKTVNDKVSYEAGDELITTIGRALKAITLPGERVVRYGGDEVVVLLEGADGAIARVRADELTSALDALVLPPEIAYRFQGASVGWAEVGPSEEPARALARAAQEMRSRKRRRKTDREALGGAPETEHFVPHRDPD